jgi:sulfite reductase beta subunit-like hemoprotein
MLHSVGLDALATANDMNRNVLCTSNPYDLFLIQPDFGIGAGARQQMLGDLFRPLVGLGVH